jgi:hypothetical protein
MTGPITRAFDAFEITEKNDTERSIVARINTSEIDRFNSVFLASGAKLENYTRGARPVLWGHGKDPRRGADPIGTCRWIRKMGSPVTEIRACTHFLKDDFSQQRYEWYRDGVLSGFSVSGIPDWTQCGPATKEEIRTNPALGRGISLEHKTPGVFMYRSWEFTEYSAVSVGGNPSCMTTERANKLIACIERGLWIPDPDLAELQAVVARGAEEPIARTGPYVDTDGQSWVVRGIDGRPIAAFPDERIAALCLAEIGRSTEVKIADLMMANHHQLMSQFEEIRRDIVNEIKLRKSGDLGSR